MRALSMWWDTLNADQFGGRMRRPLIGVDPSARLGSFKRSTRELLIGGQLLAEAPWVTVVEVLRHEMAHQFVLEVLGERDETAHGPVFQEVCRQRGIDATAAGLPTGGQPSEDRVLRRIERLLALGGSANEHEARAALAQAQRLMIEHGVEAHRVGARSEFVVRQYGPVMARTPTWLAIFLGAVNRHFDVAVVRVPAVDVATAKEGSAIEISGRPERVEVVVYVLDAVQRMADRLWREHKRATGQPGDRNRRSYLEGVAMGFAETMRAEEVRCAETGLVRVGDPELDGFHAVRHPRVTRRRASVSMSADRVAGQEAGRSMKVAPGVAERGRTVAAITGPRSG